MVVVSLSESDQVEVISVLVEVTRAPTAGVVTGFDVLVVVEVEPASALVEKTLKVVVGSLLVEVEDAAPAVVEAARKVVVGDASAPVVLPLARRSVAVVMLSDDERIAVETAPPVVDSVNAVPAVAPIRIPDV